MSSQAEVPLDVVRIECERRARPEAIAMTAFWCGSGRHRAAGSARRPGPSPRACSTVDGRKVHFEIKRRKIASSGIVSQRVSQLPTCNEK